MTLLLLLVMSRLVATDFEEPVGPPPIKVKPIHIPETKPTVFLDPAPERPGAVPEQPKVTTVDRQVDPSRITTVIRPPGPTAEHRNPVAVSRDPVPVFKPAPRYPPVALRRGMEGYVVVEFTISETGSVVEPRVVAGYDSAGQETRVFDRAALSAVSRFKYQPQMDDGVPVRRYGVRNRISFRLAE
ncbi:energy transducer TonB [Microbulbifer sediminum]|uniref:energy transducer TonB n=1 Tax=Microbulbifer sediminum TaxID=2904250 RepID=UPI001F028307|nr:energy transducer TonB [Microbulbifer sediminum]